MKIILTVSAIHDIPFNKKMEYVRGFFSKYNYGEDSVQKGFLLKFNNSIGFNRVVHQPISASSYSCDKIENPECYKAPLELLSSGACFFNKRNEIISFVVDDCRQYHSNRRFSYDPLDIILKFQNFLYKVFADDIKIEIIHKDFNICPKIVCLSTFYIYYCIERYPETEVSISRLLKKKEIDYIINFFSKLGDTVKIEQGWCETCYGYDHNNPYHVFFDIKTKTRKEN